MGKLRGPGGGAIVWNAAPAESNRCIPADARRAIEVEVVACQIDQAARPHDGNDQCIAA
jgi:hypothetical protein